MNKLLKSLPIAFCLVVSSAHSEALREGRYSMLSPGASDVEKDPLSVNVAITFPPSVVTVGDALNYLLISGNSGWVFAEMESIDSPLATLMSRPLPQVHRQMSKMPLRESLQTLVGAEFFVPVEDPIRRIYAFDVKEEYKGLIDHE